MKFAEKLYELRKKNNLSQEELALKLNVTREDIYNWEIGTSTPDKEKLDLLVDLFNTSYNYLLDDDVNSEKELGNVITDHNDIYKKAATATKGVYSVSYNYAMYSLPFVGIYLSSKLIKEAKKNNNKDEKNRGILSLFISIFSSLIILGFIAGLIFFIIQWTSVF